MQSFFMQYYKIGGWNHSYGITLLHVDIKKTFLFSIRKHQTEFFAFLEVFKKSYKKFLIPEFLYIYCTFTILVVEEQRPLTQGQSRRISYIVGGDGRVVGL